MKPQMPHMISDDFYRMTGGLADQAFHLIGMMHEGNWREVDEDFPKELSQRLSALIIELNAYIVHTGIAQARGLIESEDDPLSISPDEGSIEVAKGGVSFLALSDILLQCFADTLGNLGHLRHLFGGGFVPNTTSDDEGAAIIAMHVLADSFIASIGDIVLFAEMLALSHPAREKLGQGGDSIRLVDIEAKPRTYSVTAINDDGSTNTVFLNTKDAYRGPLPSGRPHLVLIK